MPGPQPHWTDPGVDTVAPGVHRIPLPLPLDGLRAVNVYALETDEGLVCIDGGWAVEAARQQMELALETLGYSPRDIVRFLVTHVHRDHYTQAVAVRREYGVASVGLGAGEAATLRLVQQVTPRFDQRILLGGAEEIARRWPRPDPDEFGAESWADPDEWLVEGATFDVGGRTLVALETPGHTAGHLVFVDFADGLMFAGDHLLPTITPSLGFEAAGAAQPLGDYLASLLRVRQLADLRLLPAHGEPGGSTHDRIDELLTHHDQRLTACLEAVRGGAATAYEVATELPWTRRDRHLAELDDYNAGLAVIETMVHLDLLWSRGLVTRAARDGVARYGPVPPAR